MAFGSRFAFGKNASHRKVAAAFARQHGLIYFTSVTPEHTDIPLLRNSTNYSDQKDSNHCIGTHAGYDLALVERQVTVAYEGYASRIHDWYMLQIDLKSAAGLPFIFIGTKQQSKAYYARLLAAHREIRHLSLERSSEHIAKFHGAYAVLASPADTHLLYTLLNDETIDAVAVHRYPFAVEIEGDSLTVITEALKPSKQLLDDLLHYGLWLAKRIDESGV